MTLISKTAGALSLISCLTDMHKTALIYANNAYAKASSDTFISCSIGTQKANKVSHKDAERKNWLLRNNFFGAPKELFARIRGYLSGLAEGAVRYLPNFVLSLAAICANKNSKILANVSTILLAGVELYDFIKNSSNISQRTDYLE